MPDRTEQSRELIIHVGFPKTATTLLQRRLFARAPGLAYVGKRASSQQLNRVSAELARTFLWSSTRIWQGRGNRVFREFTERLDDEMPGSAPVLLSYEELTGSCFGSMRVCNRFGAGRQVGVDPAVLVERIRAFAHNAWQGPMRVLITVRRQDTFLASLFAQTFLWRSATPANSFERFVETVCDTDFYSAGGLALDYDWLASEFERSLGDDAVQVLVYEDIADDPQCIADRLHVVAGIPPEATRDILTDTGWKVRSTDQESWRVQKYRGTNRLKHAVQWIHRRLSGIPNPASIALTQAQSREILDVYESSNRRLGKRLGRPLGTYGYYPES